MKRLDVVSAALVNLVAHGVSLTPHGPGVTKMTINYRFCRMVRKFWLLALGVVLLSCEKDSVSTSATNNRDIAVEFLFEHDGVRVYRFYDHGSPVYYADARGRTMWRHSNGKTTRPVESSTVASEEVPSTNSP